MGVCVCVCVCVCVLFLFYELLHQLHLLKPTHTHTHIHTQASAAKLAELNPYVPVHVLPGAALSEEDIKKFRVVCLTDQPLSEQLRVNGITHTHTQAFISSEIRGVFGSVFCDFGENFKVFDPNDEAAVTAMVGSITQVILCVCVCVCVCKGERGSVCVSVCLVFVSAL